MPEGVEIKVLGNQIRPLLLNKKIVSVVYDKNKHFKSFEKFIPIILGTTIKEVNAYGKHLSWLLDNSCYVNFSFGMTGSFSTKSSQYSRVGFFLDSKEFPCIFYDDIRCFGNVTVNNFSTAPLGLDPFCTNYTFNNFKNLLIFAPKKRIAEYLLDQNYIAGIGNYLRAEILYRSKICPWRRLESLNDQEKRDLYKNIITVMDESYRCGGATLATYKSLNGAVGTFVDKLQVYKKKKDPDGNDVVKELDKTKRAMWWVPAVQK